MELEGTKAIVLGAGKSGVAAAAFLKRRGAKVALHDIKPQAEWTDEARSLKNDGIGLIDGELPMWLMDSIQLCVVSPGVPSKSIPVRYMERAGAEVIGEVELAAQPPVDEIGLDLAALAENLALERHRIGEPVSYTHLTLPTKRIV